jgi:tRNA 2-thiouridine synthesizing protein E
MRHCYGCYLSVFAGSLNESNARYEGYVKDPEDWDQDLARQMVAERDLELTDEYWQILDFMRAYWAENRVTPDVRHIVKYLVKEHGYEMTHVAIN